MEKNMYYYILISAMTILCCEKNDKEKKSDPEPVKEIPETLLGSWLYESIRQGDAPCEKLRWVFEKTDSETGTFEWYWLGDILVFNEYLVIGAAKGTYTVSDNMLYPVAAQFGSQQKELYSLEFYDTVVWYHPTDAEFSQFEFRSSYEFQIKQQILILKCDDNHDGDFEDEYKTISYLKEN